MFETAIEAGGRAAATWTPECPEPGAGRCCLLCFDRYRMLVLDGPLHGLPHVVAHAVVQGVDEGIRARVRTSSSLRQGDAERARRAEATGGLLVVALEELGDAETRLAELRRRCTEPALERWLATHPVDEIPDAWT